MRGGAIQRARTHLLLRLRWYAVLRGRMKQEDGAVFLKALETMVAAQNPPAVTDEETANLPKKTFPMGWTPPHPRFGISVPNW